MDIAEAITTLVDLLWLFLLLFVYLDDGIYFLIGYSVRAS